MNLGWYRDLTMLWVLSCPACTAAVLVCLHQTAAMCLTHWLTVDVLQAQDTLGTHPARRSSGRARRLKNVGRPGYKLAL
jgi:hypothetical protein